MFLFVREICITPLQGFPHPNPLPEGEGIISFFLIHPKALPGALYLRAVGAYNSTAYQLSMVGYAVL